MAGAIAEDRESCQFPFVLDEKPTVVPVGSAGERSGGAQEVSHGAARSNSHSHMDFLTPDADRSESTRHEDFQSSCRSGTMCLYLSLLVSIQAFNGSPSRSILQIRTHRYIKFFQSCSKVRAFAGLKLTVLSLSSEKGISHAAITTGSRSRRSPRKWESQRRIVSTEQRPKVCSSSFYGIQSRRLAQSRGFVFDRSRRERVKFSQQREFYLSKYSATVPKRPPYNPLDLLFGMPVEQQTNPVTALQGPPRNPKGGLN